MKDMKEIFSSDAAVSVLSSMDSIGAGVGIGVGIGIGLAIIILYMDDNSIIPKDLIGYLRRIVYYADRSKRDKYIVNMHYKNYSKWWGRGHIFDSFDDQAVNLRRMFPGHYLEWITVDNGITQKRYLAVRVKVGMNVDEYKWVKAVFKEEIKMLTNYRPAETQTIGSLNFVKVHAINDSRIYVSREEAGGNS